MLLELRIRDYAVIDRLAVRLAPGLNVLSGETGAGKSIVVGALSLLLGERGSSEVVRAGADRAVVEGVFDVGDRRDILELLEEQGVEAEDGLLILRREVAATGRSRAWVNGSAATAGLIGRLGRQLVDLHGQHEHQTLLRAEEQRAILDAYAGAAEIAAETEAAYRALERARAELESLEHRLRVVIRARSERARARLETSMAKLDALSPLRVLDRGYAIAFKQPEGVALRSVADAKPGDAIAIRLRDGTLEAKVEGESR